MNRAKRIWRDESERVLVDAFAALGLSHRTTGLYMTALRRCQRWCTEHGHDMATLSPGAVQEYAETLPWTHASRRRLRSALTAFWTAVERPSPPVKAIRVPSKPLARSKALPEFEAAKLTTRATRSARLLDDRKALAALLGLYLALRRFEIASIRWSDFDDDFSWVRIVGKGDKTAELPVHPDLADALRRAHRTDSPWVFEGRRSGSHVNPTTIWKWVREFSDAQDLGLVPTHVLRHTALTTANDTTGDLRAVQEFARHSRPETTALYTRVSHRRLMGVMQSLNYDAAAEAAS